MQMLYDLRTGANNAQSFAKRNHQSVGQNHTRKNPPSQSQAEPGHQHPNSRFQHANLTNPYILPSHPQFAEDFVHVYPPTVSSPQVFNLNSLHMEPFLSVFDLFLSPFWRTLLSLPSIDSVFKEYNFSHVSEANVVKKKQNEELGVGDVDFKQNDQHNNDPHNNKEFQPREEIYQTKFFQQKYTLPNSQIITLDPTNPVNLHFEKVFLRHLQLQWTRVDPLITYVYAQAELFNLRAHPNAPAPLNGPTSPNDPNPTQNSAHDYSKSAPWSTNYQMPKPIVNDYINYSHYIPLTNTYDGRLNTTSRQHVTRFKHAANYAYATQSLVQHFANQYNDAASLGSHKPGAFPFINTQVSSSGVYPITTNIADQSRLSKPIPFKFKDFHVNAVLQSHSAQSWGWIVEEQKALRLDQDKCNNFIKSYGRGPYLSALKQGIPVALRSSLKNNMDDNIYTKTQKVKSLKQKNRKKNQFSAPQTPSQEPISPLSPRCSQADPTLETNMVENSSHVGPDDSQHPFIRRYLKDKGHLELPNTRDGNNNLILPSDEPEYFSQNWDIIDPFAEEILTSIEGRKLVLLFDSVGGFSMSKTAQNTAMDPDLLIHESTFASNAVDRYEALVKKHSTAAIAANFAKHIRAKTLVLNHFSSKYLDDTIVGIIGDRLILRYATRTPQFIQENVVLKQLYDQLLLDQSIDAFDADNPLYVDKYDIRPFTYIPPSHPWMRGYMGSPVEFKTNDSWLGGQNSGKDTAAEVGDVNKNKNNPNPLLSRPKTAQFVQVDNLTKDELSLYYYIKGANKITSSPPVWNAATIAPQPSRIALQRLYPTKLEPISNNRYSRAFREILLGHSQPVDINPNGEADLPSKVNLNESSQLSSPMTTFLNPESVMKDKNTQNGAFSEQISSFKLPPSISSTLQKPFSVCDGPISFTHQAIFQQQFEYANAYQKLDHRLNHPHDPTQTSLEQFSADPFSPFSLPHNYNLPISFSTLSNHHVYSIPLINHDLDALVVQEPSLDRNNQNTQSKRGNLGGKPSKGVKKHLKNALKTASQNEGSSSEDNRLRGKLEGQGQETRAHPNDESNPKNNQVERSWDPSTRPMYRFTENTRLNPISLSSIPAHIQTKRTVREHFLEAAELLGLVQFSHNVMVPNEGLLELYGFKQNSSKNNPNPIIGPGPVDLNQLGIDDQPTSDTTGGFGSRNPQNRHNVGKLSSKGGGNDYDDDHEDDDIDDEDNGMYIDNDSGYFASNYFGRDGFFLPCNGIIQALKNKDDNDNTFPLKEQTGMTADYNSPQNSPVAQKQQPRHQGLLVAHDGMILRLTRVSQETRDNAKDI
jgi:hypothetical protein